MSSLSITVNIHANAETTFRIYKCDDTTWLSMTNTNGSSANVFLSTAVVENLIAALKEFPTDA